MAPSATLGAAALPRVRTRRAGRLRIAGDGRHDRCSGSRIGTRSGCGCVRLRLGVCPRGGLHVTRRSTTSTLGRRRRSCRRVVSSASRLSSSSITRSGCRMLRLRLRLHPAKAEAESTSRRQGLRIGREELEQLKLLARREACGVFHGPLAARRRGGVQEGPDAIRQHFNHRGIGKRDKFLSPQLRERTDGSRAPRPRRS